MKAREKIITKTNRIIKEQRECAREISNSMLGRLLEEESLADEAVADFIINLLFAGNETTAKTMLFAVYFLTQCPRAMHQLLDEQDSLRRSKSIGEEMLTWNDYKAMPFTHCAIDETLRLGGIAIWSRREAKEDVEYQDYVIPKRCFVVPFLSAVQLDENVYNEALESIHADGWTVKIRRKEIGEVAYTLHPLEEEPDSKSFVGSPSDCPFSPLLYHNI